MLKGINEESRTEFLNLKTLNMRKEGAVLYRS